MAQAIKIRATVKGGEGEIRMRLAHPMENGRRRDPASGKLLPAHHITRMSIAINGRTMVEGSLGGAVAANPLFAFRIAEAKPGDHVSVSWVDNLGEQRRDETSFTAA
ncbi:MAG: thiosulfate oxidation carrier complex protein SoxZ [Zoogloea sp.]|nr:thiosulfate oxidation carrier complex protein SoxZ [Zoogloea sp.]